MVSIDIAYTGNLHCSATHGPSGATLETDAPKDNQGLGAAFSPTDLLATALGTCMMTIMGIVARRHAIDLAGARVSVGKEMTVPPAARRVAKLTVVFDLPGSVPVEQRPVLENAAKACPVHHSLHPDVGCEFTFRYGG